MSISRGILQWSRQLAHRRIRSARARRDEFWFTWASMRTGLSIWAAISICTWVPKGGIQLQQTHGGGLPRDVCPRSDYHEEGRQNLRVFPDSRG